MTTTRYIRLDDVPGGFVHGFERPASGPRVGGTAIVSRPGRSPLFFLVVHVRRRRVGHALFEHPPDGAYHDINADRDHGGR